MRFFIRYKKILKPVFIVLLLAVFIYLTFLTINQDERIHTKDSIYAGQAMGTAIKKTIYSVEESVSDDANVRVNECLKDLENLISFRIKDSEVSACNRNYPIDNVYPLSEQLMEYLHEEMEIWKETKGAYSPCVYPVAALWGIEDGNAYIPEESDITQALKRTNAKNIELAENGIIFHESGMMLDFGASGKGIACDEVAKVLQDTQVQGAVISIGGSILVYGDKGDKEEWHIGVQDPRDEDGKVLGVLDVPGNVVISTSGDYEKYFEYEGKRYHHIMDPATGHPAESGLISVTIISENGLQSDAMSTACFVMGLEKGMEYANSKGVDAVFVTEDKEIYLTPGLTKKFIQKAEGYRLVKVQK